MRENIADVCNSLFQRFQIYKWKQYVWSRTKVQLELESRRRKSGSFCKDEPVGHVLVAQVFVPSARGFSFGCFIDQKSALDRKFHSFSHCLQLSSKLNLLLDVLVEAVNLGPEVLG